MGRTKQPHIFFTTCKRCNAKIASSGMSHPLGRICGKCITPEEREEILQYQSGAIMKKSSNPKKERTPGWSYKGIIIERIVKNGTTRYTFTIDNRKYTRIKLDDALQIIGKHVPYENPRNLANNGLYKGFHGVEPSRKTKVYYEPPPKELLQIGNITQINYRPRKPSKRNNEEYYHKAGDLGERTIKTNLILATDKEGHNLYLVKAKNTKYPVFTDRGIIG